MDGTPQDSYAGHESGDTWVADAALAIMDHEDWSGLFITLSAIDKIGHMWGGGEVDTPANYGWTPARPRSRFTCPGSRSMPTTSSAGILDALRSKGILDETLIVLTADHGATYGQHLLRRQRGKRRRQELVCRYRFPGNRR